LGEYKWEGVEHKERANKGEYGEYIVYLDMKIEI
jgi:hypothetical protein